MPITLDATVAGPAANAYADVAAADARAALNLVNPLAVAWAASVNTERKKSALILATSDIDTIPSAEVDFIGERATSTQALEFPRDEDPNNTPSTALPPRLIAATIEYAFTLFPTVTTDPFAVAVNDKKSVTAGDVSVEWFEPSDDSVAYALSRFPAIVQRLLWPLLEFVTASTWGSGTAIRMS